MLKIIILYKAKISFILPGGKWIPCGSGERILIETFEC